MRHLILSLCLLLAAPALASDQAAGKSVGKSRETPAEGPSIVSSKAAEEVRAAELAFAKAFADRDRERFFSFILDDAIFFGRRTLTGKAQVREVWGRFFDEAEPPFRWAPERVNANGSGDLAQSVGPIHSRDGALIGHFVSIWRKQQDGSWKVAFDGPSLPPPCPAADAGAVKPKP